MSETSHMSELEYQAAWLALIKAPLSEVGDLVTPLWEMGGGFLTRAPVSEAFREQTLKQARQAACESWPEWMSEERMQDRKYVGVAQVHSALGQLIGEALIHDYEGFEALARKAGSASGLMRLWGLKYRDPNEIYGEAARRCFKLGMPEGAERLESLASLLPRGSLGAFGAGLANAFCDNHYARQEWASAAETEEFKTGFEPFFERLLALAKKTGEEAALSFAAGLLGGFSSKLSKQGEARPPEPVSSSLCLGFVERALAQSHGARALWSSQAIKRALPCPKGARMVTQDAARGQRDRPNPEEFWSQEGLFTRWAYAGGAQDYYGPLSAFAQAGLDFFGPPSQASALIAASRLFDRLDFEMGAKILGLHELSDQQATWMIARVSQAERGAGGEPASAFDGASREAFALFKRLATQASRCPEGDAKKNLSVASEPWRALIEACSLEQAAPGAASEAGVKARRAI